MNNKERRYLNMDVAEVRSDEEKGDYVSGYALKFNTRSEDLGGFVETIDSKALDSADLSDVRALIDHDPSKILGRTVAETLTLEVDDVGLRFDLRLPNTSYAKDLAENMRLGNINQCSFGFELDWNDEEAESFVEDEESGLYLRTLRKFKSIFDVSVVTYPAYSDTETTIAERSLNQFKASNTNELEREKLLLELELMELED